MEEKKEEEKEEEEEEECILENLYDLYYLGNMLSDTYC